MALFDNPAAPLKRAGSIIRLLLVAGTIVTLSPQGAMASDQSGQVTAIQQIQNRFFFYLDGARTGRPSCDCCGRWEILVGTPESQSMVAAIMTAFAARKTVQIYGTGSCVSPANDTEGVNLSSVSA